MHNVRVAVSARAAGGVHRTRMPMSPGVGRFVARLVPGGGRALHLEHPSSAAKLPPLALELCQQHLLPQGAAFWLWTELGLELALHGCWGI